MSALVCSISGTTPEDPVFSKTGYIFERRVIEKYLKANADTCPVTGEVLTADDLVSIKANKTVKPRPVTATSIPGLLSLMQSEWDSMLTEMYSLRTHLETTRNQLSHSLYQHDAACRVIARMLKERDSLRQQISQLQEQLTSHSSGGLGSDSTDETGIAQDTLEQLKTLAKSLLAQRKKRSLDDYASQDSVKQLKETASYSIHSSTSPGVTCCVVDNPTQAGPRRFWSGGMDGLVALFDLDKQKTISRLVGHLKRVNQVICQDRVVLSASDDKSVRIWTSADDDAADYRTSYVLRKHSKGVSSISLHPSRDFVTTSSKDGTWGIHDLHSATTCRMYRDLPCQFNNVSFHPDGMLLGASGADGKLYIYDLKGDTLPLAPLSSHSGPVTNIQFSENGYYLVSASEDGTVKMWDLRKSFNFDTVHPVTSAGTGYIPDKVSFDQSGQYVTACGMNGCVSVYGFESRTKLQQLCILESHADRVTSASFGYNSSYLVTSSMDRTVKVWSTP